MLNNAREKCEYCEDGKEWYSEEVFKDFPNPRMDCHIDRDKRTGEYSLVVDNAVSCKINYCPMCGRKLEA